MKNSTQIISDVGEDSESLLNLAKGYLKEIKVDLKCLMTFQFPFPYKIHTDFETLFEVFAIYADVWNFLTAS